MPTPQRIWSAELRPSPSNPSAARPFLPVRATLAIRGQPRLRFDAEDAAFLQFQEDGVVLVTGVPRACCDTSTTSEVKRRRLGSPRVLYADGVPYSSRGERLDL